MKLTINSTPVRHDPNDGMPGIRLTPEQGVLLAGAAFEMERQLGEAAARYVELVKMEPHQLREFQSLNLRVVVILCADGKKIDAIGHGDKGFVQMPTDSSVMGEWLARHVTRTLRRVAQCVEERAEDIRAALEASAF